ncbi:MAG: hypothetical protein LBS55_14595 [Prevotellaceae bacterium]|jgi:hypothetical protein|nr:hypothetical protein [Prevotellaceae bacterium]
MDSKTIVILLKDLIMEYNRVSLPCLGSFLSEYVPATISGGHIYPPSKSITFYQNEIWNDEKLENRIAQNNNVSIGVAKEELAFWIDNICVLLATGEEILLPELGRLYVSKQATLVFEQEPGNFLIESFALEPVNMQITESAKQELSKFITPVKENTKKRKKSETRVLTIGILIIAILACTALLIIFKHILTDNQYLPLPSEIPETISTTEQIKYEEYFTPKYGIVISSFEKIREARAFSKKISETSIYYIDNEMPYFVIFSYPSRKSSDNAIDSLKTIYPNAYIIELLTVNQ